MFTPVRATSLRERVSDLHAVRRHEDIVIPRGADDLATLEIAHRPREHVSCIAAGCASACISRPGAAPGTDVKPQLPELSIAGSGISPSRWSCVNGSRRTPCPSSVISIGLITFLAAMLLKL